MEPRHRRYYMPSAPLLWRPVSSPCMHACVLVVPGRERSSVEDRTRETAEGSGCRAIPLEAPRAQRRTKPLMEAAALTPQTQEGSACGPSWVRGGDSAPYLDPSFQNTAPPSQPAQHNEDTRSPVSFGHFVLLFLLNKSLSEA